MTLKEKGKRFPRAVRRLAPSPAPVPWEYWESHRWEEFSPDASAHLEAARNAGYDETGFAVGPQRLYVVDLRNMRQRNVATRFERDVRRRQTESRPRVEVQGDVAKTECTARARELELTCSICMDGFTRDKRAFKLDKCEGGLTHAFHRDCIEEWFATGSGKCAVCRANCRITIGNQPLSGSMTDYIDNMPLPGFPPSSRTRTITYHFPDGVQGPEHPHPGARFSGTTRTAYLPTPEGDTHFELLKIAFKRRLVFRVGRSITTGRDNCVVWGSIHHKTNRGHGSFGYPDDNYLSMLLVELGNNGIVPTTTTTTTTT
ncbi:hypothetical protein CTAYLR_001192 [Chrysophaeum taylorii]|uniref:RING-type E3 ubiquitin transferase n=1 Tax=Chrysophaeum taylorii TaxID=2483200 RepID=A0AAD7UCH3_9STRA|nr:hypothetical protein CTAYLR_001192 [Chrysophaeum taylorii]